MTVTMAPTVIILFIFVFLSLRPLRPNLLGNLFYVSNLNRNGHIIVCRLRIIR